MFGPCLCGDIYCNSCGPAQGNIKCFVCGVWSLDGGCVDPEACQKAEAAIMEQMDRAEEELAKFEAELRSED